MSRGSQGSAAAAVRLAFFDQHNLILLAGAVALSLAFASRWPAGMAVLLECLWLGVAATTRRFRRGGKWTRAAGAALDPEQAINDLEPAHAARARGLLQMAEEIRSLARERRLDPHLFGGGDDQLSHLLRAFVNLAAVHQRVSKVVQRAPSTRIEEDIGRLENTLAGEKDPNVRLSLRQALTLEQRRLKQREQIESQRRALDIKMDTVEVALDYLRAQIFGGSSSPELEKEVNDAVAAATFVPAPEGDPSSSLSRSPGGVARTVTGLGDP
jgi:hypothetical protein